MRGSDVRSGKLFSYVDLEERVPARHPLRAIREIVNEALAALGGQFQAIYSDIGRPSIPPEKLLRTLLLRPVGAARHDVVAAHGCDPRRPPIGVFNHGEMWRDFTYIDDIVAGVLAALDSPPPDDGTVKPGGSTKPHRIYNIGNNRSEHLMKVIGLIETECGRTAEKIMLPMQPGDVPSTYADIDAIAGT